MDSGSPDRKDGHARVKRLLVAALIVASVAPGVAVAQTATTTPGTTASVDPTAAPSLPATSSAATPSIEPTSARSIDEVAATSIVALTAGPERVGSGVLVAPDIVATSLNVLRPEMPARILVGADLLEFEVLATDDTLKVALIRAALPGMKPAAWGNSRNLRKGDPVTALGIPSVNRAVARIDGQMRAPSVAGNHQLLYTNIPMDPLVEGGPLVTPDGKVVGIVVSQGLGIGEGELGIAVTQEVVQGLLEGVLASEKAASERDRSLIIWRTVRIGILLVVLAIFVALSRAFQLWYRRMEERELAKEAEEEARAERERPHQVYRQDSRVKRGSEDVYGPGDGER